ncbi:MAG: DUF1295 domain-containing protein [Pseudomonadota bacterium]
MQRSKNTVYVMILIATLLGVGLAAAAGQGSVMYNGFSVFVLCCAFAYILNWLAFIPSAIAQTEHYYDLTGSLTYIGMIVLAVSLSGTLDTRATIVSLMVLVWAIRLGSFLFIRAHDSHKR